MSCIRLHLVAEPMLFKAFLQQLQKGVRITARIGSTVRSFLCDDLKINSQYAESRIQTLFLNGKAVDSLDSNYLAENSIIALSAAMPGLLGATLRKGGYYSSMRKEISCQDREGATPLHEGFVVLKLFNLLIWEIGHSILERGIWFKGEELKRLLRELSEDALTHCVEARVNDQSVNPMSLKQKNWGNEIILLKIVAS